MNRFQFTGNLGQDARIHERTTRGGKTQEIAFLNVATSSYVGKGPDGPEYRTDWHEVAVFNPGLVKMLKKSGTKGSKIFVEGEMATEVHGEGRERRTEYKLRAGRDGRVEILEKKNPSRSDDTRSGDYQPREDFSSDTLDDDSIPF